MKNELEKLFRDNSINIINDFCKLFNYDTSFYEDETGARFNIYGNFSFNPKIESFIVWRAYYNLYYTEINQFTLNLKKYLNLKAFA